MTTTLSTPRTDSMPLLLDRSFLIRRWQHGSDPFFWRQEKRGRLCAVSDGKKRRYTWDAVFDFEGGMPPEGLRAEYQSNLLTEHQAAGLCSVKPSYILNAARRGGLPCRRIGSAYRFVPIEIEAWQKRRFVNRKCLK
ncbi:helix-turn-helix domain-containing protein [Sulfitobacter sp.]|mgnify:FL=1|uniref:helix-turn-helix domain-containing protein n=1 Tax=Sulfitobacter sp. TaxID=1903071 RepID=UPI002630BA93|nr:helix-turn-helix domain-containing protein [Sulfitobacter sp.]